MFNPFNIVYTVLITEKATALSDKQSRYAFRVNPDANKIEIRRAVEAIFDDVEVSAVKVMNYRGKMKRMRSSRAGKRADWKKAMVTLSKGRIDLI